MRRLCNRDFFARVAWVVGHPCLMFSSKSLSLVLPIPANFRRGLQRQWRRHPQEKLFSPSTTPCSRRRAPLRRTTSDPISSNERSTSSKTCSMGTRPSLQNASKHFTMRRGRSLKFSSVPQSLISSTVAGSSSSKRQMNGRELKSTREETHNCKVSILN